MLIEHAENQLKFAMSKISLVFTLCGFFFAFDVTLKLTQAQVSRVIVSRWYLEYLKSSMTATQSKYVKNRLKS